MNSVGEKMSIDRSKLLCGTCRKRVPYRIRKRHATAMIKGTEILYDEYYGVCSECHEEIFVPGLDDKNESLIEAKYRKEKSLITIPEIEIILEKYDIDKRPLSRLLGFGELTVTRYLDGQVPSRKYSDILYDVMNNEDVMKEYADKNKDSVSEIAYSKVLKAVQTNKEYKIYNNSAERIALYIINTEQEVTNLLLQKLLYYVKSISYLYDGKTIIQQPCEAWKYGPVFPGVYDRYKGFGKQEIVINISKKYTDNLLSDNEKTIVDHVVKSFGIYNAWFLKDLTHCEEPWINARCGIDDADFCNNMIDENIIESYFKEIDQKYDIKNPAGVEKYINKMKSVMYENDADF